MFTNQYTHYNEQAMKDAIEHCRLCLPDEGCGIFVENKFIPYENKSPDKSNSFMISDNLFNQYYMDNKIQVIIHSHNDYPHASKQDLIQQREIEIPFGIINFRKGGCEHFIFFGKGIARDPLMRRPFFFGVFDCLTLVKDYSYKWSGVDIPDPPRDLNYWKDEPLFEEAVSDVNYPVNFININKTKENDFIFYKFDSKYINHVGVILPNGRILHHFINRVSCTLPKSYHQQHIHCGGRLDRNWREDDL